MGAFGIFQHASFPSLKKDEIYPFLLYEWKEKRSSDFSLQCHFLCAFSGLELHWGEKLRDLHVLELAKRKL